MSNETVFNKALLWPAVGLSTFLALVGLAGNGILLVTSLRSKRLRRKSNRLITLLCVADMWTCCGYLLVSI